MDHQWKGRALGAILFESEMIGQDDIERALAEQKRSGIRFGEALVKLGIVSTEDINWGLSHQLNIPFVRVQPARVDLEAVRHVPEELARRHHVLPYLLIGDELAVVIEDPTDKRAVDELAQLTGKRIIIGVGLPDEIAAALDSAYGPAGAGERPELTFTLDDLLADEPDTAVFNTAIGTSRGLLPLAGPAGRAKQRVLDLLALAAGAERRKTVVIGRGHCPLLPNAIGLPLPAGELLVSKAVVAAALARQPEILVVEAWPEADALNALFVEAASARRVVLAVPVISLSAAVSLLLEQASSRVLLIEAIHCLLKYAEVPRALAIGAEHWPRLVVLKLDAELVAPVFAGGSAALAAVPTHRKEKEKMLTLVRSLAAAGRVSPDVTRAFAED